MRAAFAAWTGSIAACWLTSALLLACPCAASADDSQLVLMREPTDYTEVIDAADVDDAFDLNVHLGYSRVSDRGRIQRETVTPEGGRRAALADSERVVSQLMLGIDVGLYRDLMAFLRVPLVLDDSRQLKRANGVSEEQAAALLADPADPTGAGAFAVPFRSASRAGLDYVGLGSAVAITNQERKAWLPTWVVLVEGRRAVGRLEQPCRQEDGQDGAILCSAPGGTEAVASSKKGASGISRGVSALQIETRVSKRVRYAAAYAGLAALIEWASTAKESFHAGGGSFKQTAPSRQLTATLGSELIPWEHRGRHQRVAVDARVIGTYLTAGRDYSALYDALGTAEAGSNELNGLSNLGARMKVGGRLGVDIRAARYVRFTFGAGLSGVSAHPLTAAAPCSGAADAASCGGYRPAIDAPGRRFWMASELLFDIYASGTAHF